MSRCKHRLKFELLDADPLADLDLNADPLAGLDLADPLADLDLNADPLAGLDLDCDPLGNMAAEWPRDEGVASHQQRAFAELETSQQNLDWLRGRLCTVRDPESGALILRRFGADGHRRWLSLGPVPRVRVTHALDATDFFATRGEAEYVTTVDSRGRKVFTPRSRREPT